MEVLVQLIFFLFQLCVFFLGEPTVLPFHGFHTAVINNFTIDVLPQAVQHLIQQLLTKATALRRLEAVKKGGRKKERYKDISLHQCAFFTHTFGSIYIIYGYVIVFNA